MYGVFSVSVISGFCGEERKLELVIPLEREQARVQLGDVGVLNGEQF